MVVAPTIGRVMLSAFAEHHRSHHATEWAHIKLLRHQSRANRLDALRSMLGEFGLLRCLEKDAGPKSLAMVIDKMAASSPIAEKDILHLARCSQVKRSATKSGAHRSFLSGASKVLWFTHGHIFPMIDRWTKFGLKTNDAKFFNTLISLQYCAANQASDKAFRDNACSKKWFSSARFWDKFFFFLGFERTEKWYPFRCDDVLEAYLEDHSLNDGRDIIEDLAGASDLKSIKHHFARIIT